MGFCAQINDRSSVLRCSLGTTLARMGNAGAAIKGLRAAISADGANPLARFELAGALLGQERFQEALQELTRLRVSAPSLDPLLTPASALLAGPAWAAACNVWLCNILNWS